MKKVLEGLVKAFAMRLRDQFAYSWRYFETKVTFTVWLIDDLYKNATQLFMIIELVGKRKHSYVPDISYVEIDEVLPRPHSFLPFLSSVASSLLNVEFTWPGDRNLMSSLILLFYVSSSQFYFIECKLNLFQLTRFNCSLLLLP